MKIFGFLRPRVSWVLSPMESLYRAGSRGTRCVAASDCLRALSGSDVEGYAIFRKGGRVHVCSGRGRRPVASSHAVLLRSTFLCPDGPVGGQVSRNLTAGHRCSAQTSAEHMKRHNSSETEFKAMYGLRSDAVARYCLRRLPEHTT